MRHVVGLLAATALVAACGGPHDGVFVVACDLRHGSAATGGGSAAPQQCIDYTNVSGDVTLSGTREVCETLGGTLLGSGVHCAAEGVTARCHGERANAALVFYAPTTTAAATAACDKLPGTLDAP